MHTIGHKGLSMLLYTPVLAGLLYFEFYILAVLGLLIMVFTSMIPDMDMTSTLATHRGMTHSIFFACMCALVVLVLFIALWVYTPIATYINSFWFYSGAIVALVMYGVICHILGDALNPTGVKPFAPVSDRRISGRVRSRSWFWNWCFYFIGLLSVIAVFILIIFLV